MLGAVAFVFAALVASLVLNYIIEPEMRWLVKDRRNSPR